MARATITTQFAKHVRAEMDRQGLSIRGLARRMDPANLDRARRNLHRWLDDGMMPSHVSRQEIAAALGVHEADLPTDDDEEADPLVDLMNALRRVVREEMLANREQAAEAQA